MAVNDDNRASSPSGPSIPPSNESSPASATADPPMASRHVQIPELLLRTTLWRLQIVRSMVTTAAMALVYQNADVDADIANVLRTHVVDALTAEIDALNSALETDTHNQGVDIHAE